MINPKNGSIILIADLYKATEKEMPYNDVPYEHSLTTISRDLLNSILEEKWGVKYE